MKNKYGTTEWTLWDRFEFKADPTLKDIISYFETEHGFDVCMVSQGVSMLWSSFIGKQKASCPLLRECAQTLPQNAESREALYEV